MFQRFQTAYYVSWFRGIIRRLEARGQQQISSELEALFYTAFIQPEHERHGTTDEWYDRYKDADWR